MNPLTETDDTQPAHISTTTVIAIVVTALMVIISCVAYPLLPDIVPTHWNIQGQIDSYGSKVMPLVLLPAISIFLYVFVRALLMIGPRLGSGGQQANMEVVNRILVAMLLFFLLIHCMIIALSAGLQVDALFVISIAMNVLFIVIGNYLGKLRRNFWAGIRTPWTLVNNTVLQSR